MKKIHITKDLEISYLGPDIKLGPLPAIFYFFSSEEESLLQDPYNQPADFLSSFPMRVFSMTVPGHGPELPTAQAIHIWADHIDKNDDLISEFVEKVKIAFDFLVRDEILFPEKTGVMGLSRGAFIASHVAAKISSIKYILGFAPLTRLDFAKEFVHLQKNPLAESLNLVHLIPHLIDRNLRFYIGNLDAKVSTELCFDFIHKLSQAAYQKKIRSPQTELIIGPSIGHQGHGTSREVFHQGASWLAHMLGVFHEKV